MSSQHLPIENIRQEDSRFRERLADLAGDLFRTASERIGPEPVGEGTPADIARADWRALLFEEMQRSLLDRAAQASDKGLVAASGLG